MKKKLRLMVAVIACLLLTLLLACPVFRFFEIRDPNGRLLFARAVSAGDRITLKYIHSVARRPVDEIWEISPDNRLVLCETEYDSFGAGLPTELAPGESLVMKDGQMRIIGMNRPMDQIWLAVGTIAEHRLEWEGGGLALTGITPAGSRVNIKTARRPFWWGIFRF